MLVDIMNEQSKTDNVKLIVVNNVYNSELIRTLNASIDVHLINRIPGSRNPIKLLQFNLTVLKFKPDVIHFHDHKGIKLLLYKANSKTFLTIHGLRQPIQYLRKYDHLISISETVKDDLLKRGQLKSTIIYNGIDFSKLLVKTDYTYKTFYKLVHVSRLYHEIKGQDILLQALHHLVYTKGIKSLKLDFIGEGPSLNHLQNLVQKFNLGDFVRFLGLKDRHFIYSNLLNYDVLVQPSIHEGFGLTIIEAMGAKIPVVVSNIDGPLEVIREGQFGYYFNSQDSYSCAETIEKVIYNLKESSLSEFLNNNYDYAFSNYSVQNSAQNYLRLYKDQII
jgi:glycosyltransferase involved in cell wall biosynthesis